MLSSKDAGRRKREAVEAEDYLGAKAQKLQEGFSVYKYDNTCAGGLQCKHMYIISKTTNTCVYIE